MTVQDYLDLITSSWAQKPKFTAMITAVVGVPVQVQALMQSMNHVVFDVDIAVGNQLDIIGQWVGIGRYIGVPIPGVFFSWDTDNLGWEYGSWQPPNEPTDVTALPDDAYRLLIKAKIAANQWDGTIEGAYQIWDSLFTTTTILIQDNQDMSYDLCVVGGIIDALSLELITGGYIPLKPEGVLVYEYFISSDTNPLFAWDAESAYLAGWETGSWAIEVGP